MSEDIRDRRRLVGTAVLTLAAAELSAIAPAKAQTRPMDAIRAGTAKHDATFDRSAASFDNPDHVSIVIHNYRWRLALAAGEARYDDLEKRLATAPVVTEPKITMRRH